MKKLFIYSLLVLINIMCGRSVKRLTSDSDVYDLSGDFSHTDYIEFSQKISHKIRNSSFISDYETNYDEVPRILVDEAIIKVTTKIVDPSKFTPRIEKALMVYKNRLKVVAGGIFREKLRTQRASQQYHTSPKTKVELFKESGANVLLSVELTEDNDPREGSFMKKKQEFRIYEVTIRFYDIKTGELLDTDIFTVRKHIKG